MLPLVPAALVLSALAGLAGLAPAASPPPFHLDRAIEAQNQLALERPDDPAVWNDLGNLLTLRPELEKAESAYRRAIELDPEDPTPRFNLALLLDRRGEHLASFRELKRVLELDPEHAWAHYQVGVHYHRWKVDPLAERAYARAFRLDPSLADARRNPQVLDNELATRAMLRAHGRAGEDLLPPRTYQEPARIAGLLIDTPPGAAPQPEASGEAGGFARLASGGTAAPAAPAPKSDEESPEAEPKTLSARDLEPGRSINQVTAPGGAVIGGAPARGAAATPGARTPRTFGGRARPTPTNPQAPPAAGGSSGGPAFTPSNDSTGRLELRLLPPAADAAG